MFDKVISMLRSGFEQPVESRAELRAALARQEQAQRVLEEAMAATDRVQQVIDEAERAKKEAAAAEQACVAADTAVYQTGSIDTSGHEGLFEAAQLARARADRLAIGAKAAREALTARVWDNTFQRIRDAPITPAEKEARDAREKAGAAVCAAAARVIDNYAAPKVARAAELHAELVELLHELSGYRRLGRQNVQYRPSRQVCSQIDELCTLPKFGQYEENSGDLRHAMAPWDVFGNRLLKDPDAQFDEPEGRMVDRSHGH